ncbi:MAG: BamA/TamA family outer membrane protein [Gammaproteobacteria bacterium]|nr:BamA/TamA family outer membrane protein [Gammaproteobacteria bacterium]
MNRFLAAAMLGPLTLNVSSVTAEETCGAPKYTADALEHSLIEDLAGLPLDANRRYHVRALTIYRKDVFDLQDPAENNWLFGAANKYHVDTRESVIRDVIVVAADRTTSFQALEESERILRAKTYIYDARVIANRVCGDEIDVVVVTRDVWTLAPTIAVARTGGQNEFEFGVSDNNLLGTGTWISALYINDLDREGVALAFRDPNLGHSRVSLFAEYRDNDDGYARALEVVRPFYALDAKSTWGVIGRARESHEALFFLSAPFATFERDQQLVEAFWGTSNGIRDGFVNRWRFGYAYDDIRVNQITGPTLPFEDRRLSYPWVGFERIEDKFEKTQNIQRIRGTEDLFLGRQFAARVGYSNEVFGGDASKLVVRGHIRDGVGRNGHIVQYGANLSGVWNFERNEVQDFVSQAWLQYRHRHTDKLSLFASASGFYTRNLPVDRQLLLGGDTGLRGYPNRYQLGDRSVLVTLEERYFSDIYLFRMVRVGAAIFADIGRAWFRGTPKREPLGVLVDVGFGLRFDITRGPRDRIFHLDLAFPLQDGPGISSPQLTFTGKTTL